MLATDEIPRNRNCSLARETTLDTRQKKFHQHPRDSQESCLSYSYLNLLQMRGKPQNNGGTVSSKNTIAVFQIRSN